MMPMNCSMSMGPMKMYFYFGFHDVSVLFEGWDINSVGALIGTFIAIFVTAMLYEGLKVFREVIHQRKAKLYGKRINVIHYKKVPSSDDITPPPTYGTIERTPHLVSSAEEVEDIKLSGHICMEKNYIPTEGALFPSPTVPVAVSLGLHIIQTLLHMLQVTVSYFLMLVVMTYNAWLFIAVILGAGTGYFLFARFRGPGTRSLQDENEHCH